MKLKPNFEMRNICGEHVVLASGIDNINFNKIISLNGTAATIWEEASKGEFTPESLAKALTEQYEVDEVTALKDVKAILKNFEEVGVLDI